MRFVTLVALLILAVSFSTDRLTAQISKADSDKVELSIGIRGAADSIGHARLGCWAPIWITTPDQMQPEKFELTVLDGDETPVTYVGDLHSVGSELNQHQGWVKLGRSTGIAQLKLLDVHGQEIFHDSFPISGEGKICQVDESTRGLILTFESGSELTSAIATNSNSISGSDSEVVIQISSASQLPMDWFCLEGVDTLLIMTSNLKQIESISLRQWNGIEHWVQNGGRVIVSVASNADKLLADNAPLRKFCPGNFAGVGEMTKSGRLEAFSNNGQLIARGDAAIPIAKLTDVTGVALVNQDEHPLIVRSGFGLGEVVFVAFDLDSERITQWKGFGNLVHRIEKRVDAQRSAQSHTSESRSGSVSHYGYEDLVGQLRVPLDRFSSVQFVAFTLIAVLIGIYILLIGPGDYFLLSKLIGKMELTWITFPLIALLFCGLAYWISEMTRPDSIQLNQLEIIDIDSQSNRVRGSVWNNLYSPDAGSCSVSMGQDNSLGIDVQSKLLSWQGLPGDGLGGMQTKANTGIARTGYRHLLEMDDKGMINSTLENVPTYVSSTKALFTQWNGTFEPKIRSRLVSSGSSQLTGTFSNPLDVPLYNVRLMFNNYAYVLRTSELQSGETVDLLSETKERTVRSLLTRRTKTAESENKSINVPWEPTDTNVPRIADMLMFHEAAGGSNYTGLTHSFQDFVDMSHQLDLKQAILVGQVKQIGSELEIDGESVTDQYDQAYTFVRIVLPVEYRERRRK